MCHPAVGLVLTIASTALSAVAQQQQAKAASAAAQQSADYNSKVAANEAETRRQLAQAEMQKGAEERNRLIRAGLVSQGSNAAGMGASGFVLDQGTNLSLLGQGAEEISQDAAIVSQNAQMAAWQHLAGATAADNEGAFGQWNAKAQTAANKAGSKLGMVGTILGGAAQAVGGYNAWAGSGTPGAGSGITQIYGRPGQKPIM
jgi:hypothetical protein